MRAFFAFVVLKNKTGSESGSSDLPREQPVPLYLGLFVDCTRLQQVLCAALAAFDRRAGALVSGELA